MELRLLCRCSIFQKTIEISIVMILMKIIMQKTDIFSIKLKSTGENLKWRKH